jgi:adenine-specific DNA glycosylase
MSIAFNKPFPIVDGNVRRVLSRLRGWTDAEDSAIWTAAEEVVRSGVPRVVNQAMMELGATCCTFRRPNCERCPWKGECVAYRTGRQAEIPAPRKRQKTLRVDLAAIVDRNRSGFLMREEQGMWAFPLMPEPPDSALRKVGHCRHSVTHHRLEVDVYSGSLANPGGYRRVRIDELPVTALTRKICRIFEESLPEGRERNPHHASKR